MNVSEEAALSAQAFDAIGERYEAAFGNNEVQIAVVERFVAHLPPGARVLDLGCGTGRPTAAQLVRAGCAVTGVDISEEMLRLARENVPGATFLHSDILSVDLPEGSFDGVTCFFVLLMMRRADIDKMLRRIHDLLVPGGRFACSFVAGDFDGLEIPFLGQPVRLSAYPLATLLELLQAAGFTNIEQEELRFPPAGGDSSETQLFFLCQRSATAAGA